jgi:hypothetical protein
MPFTFFDFPPWKGGQTIASGELGLQQSWIKQSVTNRYAPSWERRRLAQCHLLFAKTRPKGRFGVRQLAAVFIFIGFSNAAASCRIPRTSSLPKSKALASRRQRF